MANTASGGAGGAADAAIAATAMARASAISLSHQGWKARIWKGGIWKGWIARLKTIGRNGRNSLRRRR